MWKETLGLAPLMETQEQQSGATAAFDGQDKTQNPYLPGTGRWKEWNLGWRLATRQIAANANRAAIAESPNLSPFELGEAAGRAGKSAMSNPFVIGGPDNEAWRLGWAKARA